MKFCKIISKIVTILSICEIQLVLSNPIIIEEQQAAIPHDSLNSSENILNIQDDFPVYENFQYITEEKTVYVTLNPTTIFVTITETVVPTNTIVITETKKEFVVPTSVPISNSTSIEEIISSVIIIETKTDITTSLTTEYVKATNILTPPSLSLPISNTTISSTSISISIPIVTSSSILEVIPGAGELDMILGDRKNFFETSKSFKPTILSTSIVPSPIKSSVSIPSSTNVIISDTTTPINDLTITNSNNIFDPFSNVITTSTTPSSTAVNYSTSQSYYTKTLYNNNGSSNGNGTNTNGNNMTGLEQLLENFSPYTDLPAADYELSNDGNRVKVTGFIGAIVCCILGYVI